MTYSQNQKATGLDALTSLDSTDVFVTGDVSDSGRAKKITRANLITDIKTNDNFYYAGGTDVAVADGGTGISNYSKGDLLVASASTLIALPVGNDGEVLTAASGETLGIKYDTIAANITAPVTRTYNLADSPATWPKPANLKYVDVKLWAAGASGGSNTGDAGGGGGGAYITKRFFASEVGSTETITIGAGGAAVSNSAGNVGGNSSFGSHITAYGGGGGGISGQGPGGGGGGIASVGLVGSSLGGNGGDLSGGIGATGTRNSNFGGGAGTDGTTGNPPGESIYGGGGGGGHGGSAAEGLGGNSYYGGGGGGGGNAAATTGGTSIWGGNGGNGGDASPTPTAGTVPAGGGGGSNDDAVASGAGAAGRVIVIEYYA